MGSAQSEVKTNNVGALEGLRFASLLEVLYVCDKCDILMVSQVIIITLD